MHHSPPELRDWDLLVLTDEPGRGYAFLQQPYQEAAVRELAGDPAGLDVAGRFAVVVVDRSPFDLDWLGTAVGRVRSVQPGARILVPVDRPAEPQPERSAAGGSFDGLAWDGLVTVNGRICAMLATAPSGGSPDQIASLLATAHQAVRLTAGDGSRVAVADAERLLTRQIEDQRRSERALLTQLERLTDRPRPPAPPTPTLRAVIRGSKLGPPARAALHATRRVTGRLRRTGAALRRLARAGR